MNNCNGNIGRKDQVGEKMAEVEIPGHDDYITDTSLKFIKKLEIYSLIPRSELEARFNWRVNIPQYMQKKTIKTTNI